jgi:hypothetical protein
MPLTETTDGVTPVTQKIIRSPDILHPTNHRLLLNIHVNPRKDTFNIGSSVCAYDQIRNELLFMCISASEDHHHRSLNTD